MEKKSEPKTNGIRYEKKRKLILEVSNCRHVSAEEQKKTWPHFVTCFDIC